MKCILFLILICLQPGLIFAAVDTNHSAALINDPQATQWEKMQAAMWAVLSKKSGLSATELDQQYTLDDSVRTAILRTYIEELPAQFEQDSTWFHMVVDEDQIHQIMLDQQIPVWPARRSELFVWVVEEIQDQPLIHADTQSESVYWLKKWFDVAGVPTQFYDPSAEDLLTFVPNDVRFLNPDLIDYIQANNDSQQLLMVFIKHTGSGYSYRFGLVHGDKPVMIRNLQFLDLAAGMRSLTEIVQGVVAQDQRLFATEFSQNTVSVSINDVMDADHLLRLSSYLDNHALIDHYQIHQYQANQLKMVLRIEVLPDTFVKFIEQEGLLQHVPLDLGQSILFNWVQ